MKKRTLIGTAMISGLLVLTVFSSQAEGNSANGKGTIGFKGEYPQEIYDPENPGTVVDPGETPQTQGALRIDFVPQLRFGVNDALNRDTAYPVFAQLFKDSTPARGNFVQVSDYRGTGAGWQLSVKQEAQFEDEKGNRLDGTIISINHSWANSQRESSQAPIVKKEVIEMTVGNTQVLAKAEPKTGEGTWSINFGASATNSNEMTDTLFPLLNEEGVTVTDPLFLNKPIYLNQAIQLQVPGKIKKATGTTYSTVITWTLSELP